jgi:hypothetical protein
MIRLLAILAAQFLLLTPLPALPQPPVGVDSDEETIALWGWIGESSFSAHLRARGAPRNAGVLRVEVPSTGEESPAFDSFDFPIAFDSAGDWSLDVPLEVFLGAPAHHFRVSVMQLEGKGELSLPSPSLTFVHATLAAPAPLSLPASSTTWSTPAAGSSPVLVSSWLLWQTAVQAQSPVATYSAFVLVPTGIEGVLPVN